MVLSKRAFGLSMGVVYGLFSLIGTWWLVLIGSGGATIGKLHKFFIGYSLTWGGGIIALIWGFVYGFIAGFLLAWVYNKIAATLKQKVTS